MAEDTGEGRSRPKLHAATTLTQLRGAGVVAHDVSMPADPDRIVLMLGDSAAYVALDGPLSEVHDLVSGAMIELGHLRERRLEQRAPGHLR